MTPNCPKFVMFVFAVLCGALTIIDTRLVKMHSFVSFICKAVVNWI